MNIYVKPKYTSNRLKGTKGFEGKSIEKEIKQLQTNGTPITRGITNMFYTQRKHGIVEETDIRTDKWQLAQDAMSHANEQFQNAIKQKLEENTQKQTQTQTQTE